MPPIVDGKMPTHVFKNYQHKVPVPFVIYGDFEAVLKDLPPTEGNTQKTQVHEPYSFALKCVCSKSEYENEFIHMEYHIKNDGDKKTVLEVFWEKLDYLRKKIDDIIEHPMEMVLSVLQQEEFDNATHCWICEKELGTRPAARAVRVVNEKYVGPQHYKCRKQNEGKPDKIDWGRQKWKGKCTDRKSVV